MEPLYLNVVEPQRPFFEIWEDYLERGLMDIFVLLEEYHKHIININSYHIHNKITYDK